MGDADHLQMLRPLGADRSAFVAREASGGGASRVVIVDRVTRASSTRGERAAILRRARALAGHIHPKVVPVREVVERNDEVIVISDFIDGEWLSDLMAHQRPRPPLELLLRVLLDVLEGIASLHELHEEGEPPWGYVHGGLSPSTVLVSDDGVAQIAHASRLVHPSAEERYVAPELRRGEAGDARSDVFSVGAMLRDVLADAPPEKKWAEALTEVAWRGALPEPKERWPVARAMAEEMRRRVGTKLSRTDDVGAFIRANFGLHMRARRAALDILDDVPPPPPPPSSSELVSMSEIELVPSTPRPQTPTPAIASSSPPPVPAKAHAVARVALKRAQPPSPQPPPDADGSQEDLRPSAGTLADALAQRVPLAPPDVDDGGVLAAAPAAAVEGLDDAYRRRLPTIRVDERERIGGVWLGLLVAAGMLGTFATGWWLGRRSVQIADTAPQAACVPAPTTTVVDSPTATMLSTPVVTATTTAPTAAPPPSASFATAPPPSSVTPLPSAAPPTPTAAPAAPAKPTSTPVAAAAPKPPAPRKATPATGEPSAPAATAPKPANTSYVPSEL